MSMDSNVAQHPALTDEERRRQLREKIEAGEQRNAERSLTDYARDAADTATGFARKHPIAVVAGAVAVGLAIGAMTKPGRRLGRKGGALAALAADAAIAYGLKAMSGAEGLARTAGDRFEDLGDTIGAQTRNLRRDAIYKADVASDALRTVKRTATRKGGRALRDLRSRFTD